MKLQRCASALFLFPLLCAAFTACAARPDPASAPVSAPASAAVSSAVVSAAPISSAPAPGPVSSVPAVTDDQIEEAYGKAVEAYGWFDLTTMPVEDGPGMEYDGRLYQKVRHDTIKTYAQLETYLHTLFSDDIVAGLLNRGDGLERYRDIDGELYAIPADRGTDITKGDETRRIVRESDSKAIVEVTVQLLDPETGKAAGQEVHDFSYRYRDGKWIFETFGLVR